MPGTFVVTWIVANVFWIFEATKEKVGTEVRVVLGTMLTVVVACEKTKEAELSPLICKVILIEETDKLLALQKDTHLAVLLISYFICS